MSKRNGRTPPALKHAAYSGIALLPGEDANAFNKLHKELFTEFAPSGPLEWDIVATMARLMWRKQNLATYRFAKLARHRYSEITSQFDPKFEMPLLIKDPRTPEQIRADRKAAEEEAKRELGEAMDFVEMGGDITFDSLLNELQLVERLDGVIDRCLKRLLMVRGLKSLSLSAAAVPSGAERKVIA
jgi:hypothetical protein